MIRVREGVVTEVRAQWPGARELSVAVDDDDVRALAYTAVVGAPEPGDRVILNATALLMGLGTGGYAMVIAIPDRLPADPASGPGHLVKARYTPLQTTVLGVDEQESPEHDVLRDVDDLDGMPVVVGVRRRLRGRLGALGTAGGAARGRRRHRRRGSGARQPRDRHPVGVLRRRGR